MRVHALWFSAIVAIVSLADFPVSAGESKVQYPIGVVATIPVLKDLAVHVGGPHVRVTSLMSGLESEHTYSPKPSDVMAIRNARVLLEVGAGLEVWVTSLVRNAANASLRVVTTSKGIALIRDHEPDGKPSKPNPKNQQAGNPHIWLDPENAKIMMRHITEALIKVDPDHAPDYRDNQAAYLRQLDDVQTELIELLKPLSDRRLIVHHPAWPYFARRFGFRVADHIVRQAGAEPSAKHLQTLTKRIVKDRIRVIVSEPQLNQKIPEALARETGARVAVLTPMPGGLPGTDTYLDMLRYDVMQLTKAFEPS